MRLCHRCGRENPDDVTNCVRCGIKLDSIEAQTDYPPQEPENFCYKHKKEKTNLACGRCGKFICTNCVVLGPAGPRCRECAKQDISLRPAALVYDIKVRILALIRAPYAIWILIIALGVIGGMVRSCSALLNPPKPVPYSQYKQDHGGKDAGSDSE